MIRPLDWKPPSEPITLDSPCDCDWSGSCAPCKALDFRRNGGLAYRLLRDDIEEKVLLARNIQDAEAYARSLSFDARHEQWRAAKWAARGRWARGIEEDPSRFGTLVDEEGAVEAQQYAAEVHRNAFLLLDRLITLTSWLARAKRIA